MDDLNRLKGVVNKSGFPLQIGITHLINSGTDEHGWSVQYSEHAWQNSDDDNSGFIDLVLEHKNRQLVLVLECKRVQDTSWVFLNPKKNIEERSYAKVWGSRYKSGEVTEFGWVKHALSPNSVQSGFVCIFGQKSNSTPMLEKVSAVLVSSTEALAIEEKLTLLSSDYPYRVYLNVIVTTAKLKVCSFDPADISLNDGTVSNCSFSEVPYIRFQKQLSTRFPYPITFHVGDSSEIMKAKENTVFVVHAEELVDFISALEL